MEAEWFITRDNLNVTTIFEKAIHDDAIDKSLLELLPQQDEYTKLREYHARYKKIVLRGAWPIIPDGSSLKKGESDMKKIAGFVAVATLVGGLAITPVNDAEAWFSFGDSWGDNWGDGWGWGNRYGPHWGGGRPWGRGRYYDDGPWGWGDRFYDDGPWGRRGRPYYDDGPWGRRGGPYYGGGPRGWGRGYGPGYYGDYPQPPAGGQPPAKQQAPVEPAAPAAQ